MNQTVNQAVQIVSYLRLSREGGRGLGIDAQRAAISRYAKSIGARVATEFIEIESGANDRRPELARAIAYARRNRLPLAVKTLCRLGRHAAATLATLERVSVIVTDNPNASPLEFQLRAVIDEEERRRISERTRAALAVLKSRGVVLGTPGNMSHEAQKKGAAKRRTDAKRDYASIADQILRRRQRGETLQQICDALNASGETTRTGSEFKPNTVRRIIERTTQNT